MGGSAFAISTNEHVARVNAKELAKIDRLAIFKVFGSVQVSVTLGFSITAVGRMEEIEFTLITLLKLWEFRQRSCGMRLAMTGT
mmetsp:Transcript_1007/g.2045  ORF Transcript_1007/g.2045 Transcript_1007/m.2045 type:complete len:84 (-) Transcript_1007:89-340(-)